MVKKQQDFKISVSVKKYEGWRHGDLYAKAGGLYGLVIGSDRMRLVTYKVLINPDLEYDRLITLKKSLIYLDYEDTVKHDKQFWDIWKNEKVIELKLKTDEVNKMALKNIEEARVRAEYTERLGW